MSTFAQTSSPGAAESRGGGWRRVIPPVVVRAYVANGWHDLVTTDVNDLTREIRVRWPPPTEHDTGSEAPHTVLDASRYDPPGDGFPPPEAG